MKRKDVLSKDEIINVFYSYCHRESPDKCNQDKCEQFKSCYECIRSYLNEEVETVPRYSLIKQDSDLDSFRKDWELYCDNRDDCDDCPYKAKKTGFEPYDISCFINYLKEGVYSNEKI